LNILLIGSGGREHAFAWKMAQSKLCDHLFIAPGNTGTALFGTNLSIKTTDFESLKTACVEHNIEMVVVGPEDPLVKGITDYFGSNEETKHINVIGPSKNASQLEGSKAFAKSFMERHSIPTATYKEFTSNNFDEGVAYLKQHSLPIVLKADGLAAGKGVLICNSNEEAVDEFEQMIHHTKFGDAGKKVVVEEFLKGIEMSVFVLTDGKNYVLLPEAKDYKRIGVGDTGLNTGGMGAVSPLPFFDETLKQNIIKTIVEPTIAGLFKDKLDYKGFIFLGLMINKGEPFVIEYNCRMGDPETEVVLPRLKNDLVELFIAAGNQKLNEVVIETDSRPAATLVAVSGGYPGEYEGGKIIKGLKGNDLNESIIFHSGTCKKGDDIVTNGGRVLTVTSFGKDIKSAVEQSVAVMKQIQFEGMYYRDDIGYEF